jgi:DNA-binding transcriptional MerR regulator
MKLVLTVQQLAVVLAELESVTVPRRNFTYWAQAGALVPSVRYTGTKNPNERLLYSWRDVPRARLLVRLRAAGLHLGKVRLVLAHLDAYAPDVFARQPRATLVLDGWRVRLVRAGTPAQEIPDGQFVLPLAELVAGSRDAAERAAHVA